jgi:Flp pilus assembly protein TadG
MMKRLNSLSRDSAGTSTIELGLLAPLLATMLIGLVDISTAYSDMLRLEQVAQRTVERVQNSSFTPSMEATLEAEAVAAAGAGSTATLTWWLECNGAVEAWTDSCDDGETYARYVQLNVQKNYTPIILASFAGSQSNGNITLNGIAGVRTGQ